MKNGALARDKLLSQHAPMPSLRTGASTRLSLLAMFLLPFACSPQSAVTDGTGGVSTGGFAPGGGGPSAGGTPAAVGGLVAAGGLASGGSTVETGGVVITGGGGGASGGVPDGGGGGSTGGGNSAAGGSAAAYLTQAGDVVTFSWGNRALAIDAAHGARIVSLTMGDKETISQKSGDSLTNYGSTFWTSPQADWNWPPVTAIDSEAYTVTIEGGTPTFYGDAVFQSAPATVGSATFVITKTISVDAGADIITIRYGIKNTGATTANVAGWEVTRHEGGGLSFFPTGTAKPKDELSGVTESSGVTWFQHTPSTPEGKLNADGAEGWVAHAGDGFLLITAFADVPASAAAPGEGDVELYAYSDGSYVEVENQGPLVELAAGATTEHVVKWMVRETDGIAVSVGSAGLLQMVRSAVDLANAQ